MLHVRFTSFHNEKHTIHVRFTCALHTFHKIHKRKLVCFIWCANHICFTFTCVLITYCMCCIRGRLRSAAGVTNWKVAAKEWLSWKVAADEVEVARSDAWQLWRQNLGILPCMGYCYTYSSCIMGQYMDRRWNTGYQNCCRESKWSQVGGQEPGERVAQNMGMAQIYTKTKVRCRRAKVSKS